MTNALQTHQQLATTMLRSAVTDMLPRIVAPVVDIGVQGGLHDMVSVSLPGEDIRVGSSFDCDVVLLDDEIAPEHLRIMARPSILGAAVSIETKEADVMLNGHPVRVGRPTPYTSLPATLTVSKVTLKLATHQVSTRRSARLAGFLSNTFTTVLLAGLIVIVPPSLMVGLGRNSNLVVSLQQDATPEAGAEQPVQPFLDQLNSRIAAATLKSFLDVTLSPDGVLFVQGAVPPAKLAAWEEIHRWFDALPGAPPLNSRVAGTPILDELPAIAAVRLSDPPEIRFADGHVSRIGDDVSDGWKIADITNDGLVLQRNSEELRVAF